MLLISFFLQSSSAPKTLQQNPYDYVYTIVNFPLYRYAILHIHIEEEISEEN